MKSFPGEGALEPEREVVGEDFAEEPGRPPPKVPALVPQDAEILDEAAEGRLDPRRKRIACRISHGRRSSVMWLFLDCGVVAV